MNDVAALKAIGVTARYKQVAAAKRAASQKQSCRPAKCMNVHLSKSLLVFVGKSQYLFPYTSLVCPLILKKCPA